VVVRRLSLHPRRDCLVPPAALSVLLRLPPVRPLVEVGVLQQGVVVRGLAVVPTPEIEWRTLTSTLLCLASTRPAPSSPGYSAKRLTAVTYPLSHRQNEMLPSQCVLPGTPRASATPSAHSLWTTWPTRLTSMPPWPPGAGIMAMLPCDISAGAFVV